MIHHETKLLIDYGYTDFFARQTLPAKDLLPARITAVHKERYDIICPMGETSARLKAGVYYYDAQETYPTTGDFVWIKHNPIGESQIVQTFTRRSYFSRRDPDVGRGEQMVAANFDYVFILQSLNHDFNPKRLERYITLAWQSGAIPVVLLTKCDLVEDWNTELRTAQRIAAGAEVLVVSTVTGVGMEGLAEFIQPRTTIVLLGSSGVGKSSLLNALSGRQEMAVGGIREEDGRGRHTTTTRQLIQLPNGTLVIDTPGMRELGMWDVSTGLGTAYADVEEFLGQCRFSDCQHNNEPGCAIREAIRNGSLSSSRWEGYLRLKREARFVDSKEDAMQQKRKRTKEIALYQRQLKKTDYRVEPCTESFTCKACGAKVFPGGAGSQHRNHCPQCLSSVHEDNEPGDRASLCKGVMEPIGVWVRKNGEWALIHRCRACGMLSSNRIAADDNPTLLLSIAVKPLAAPPFPLAQLERV